MSERKQRQQETLGGDLLARTDAIAERVVGAVVRRYGVPPGMDRDDLLVAARLGAWEAHQSFDAAIGEYESWLCALAFRAVRETFRKFGWRYLRPWQVVAVPFDEDALGDASAPSPYEVLEARLLADEILGRATVVQREVLRLVSEGHSQREIGTITGKSQQFVSVRINEVRRLYGGAN